MDSMRQLSKNRKNSLPVLSILAQDISELAFNEKGMFSPILKKWHPLAAGVAVATLHACYGNELKQFVSSISELTPDALQVLKSADKLEKDLVLIAVADSVESEDGGKSIIQAMPPYEAEAVVAKLVKSWIRTRLDILKEWVDRNLQQEVCDVSFLPTTMWSHPHPGLRLCLSCCSRLTSGSSLHLLILIQVHFGLISFEIQKICPYIDLILLA